MIAWRHQPLPGSTPRPWTERRFAQCAFPFDGPDGATLSCCEPVIPDRPYCPSHFKVMYVPSPKRGAH